MFPPTFQFTQSNLQDYITCRRRFELHYLRQMNWPAVEAAPIELAEERMQLGSDFHRLVHQHILGLPESELAASTEETPELAAMWQNYLAERPSELAQPGVRLYPEVTLSTVVNDYRLVAKYDLLAFLPGEPAPALIVDWKTNARRPSSQTLRSRAQSRVYPLTLSLSGGSLAGTPLVPDQITLQYWFAADPTNPEVIPYSQTQFEGDRAYLTGLIREIVTTADFPLTIDERPCRFCVYRSFCNRGDVAGPLDEFDDDLTPDEFELDWEQVTEIAY